MMIVKRLGHSIKVSHGSQHNKHVEDLVRTPPNVIGSWCAPLRPSSCVEDGTEDVHDTMEHDPFQAHPILETLEAVDHGPVEDGDDARCAQADEHGGAEGSPFGGAEALDP